MNRPVKREATTDAGLERWRPDLPQEVLAEVRQLFQEHGDHDGFIELRDRIRPHMVEFSGINDLMLNNLFANICVTSGDNAAYGTLTGVYLAYEIVRQAAGTNTQLLFIPLVKIDERYAEINAPENVTLQDKLNATERKFREVFGDNYPELVDFVDTQLKNLWTQDAVRNMFLQYDDVFNGASIFVDTSEAS